MQRYNGYPIYGFGIPEVNGQGWYAQGLVFSPIDTESPIVEIKRLGGPNGVILPTKEEAEQHALELCRAWIDQHRNRTPTT